jgi:hypothetical protein
MVAMWLSFLLGFVVNRRHSRTARHFQGRFDPDIFSARPGSGKHR